MTKKANALVLCGDGINCEEETVFALNAAGIDAAKIHCSDLLNKPEKLDKTQLIVFPGGFSFGDEIASGKVLAIKLREKLQEALHKFIERGNLLIGICNGFQILAQLEILPDSNKDAQRTVSLCHNEGGQFINKWVKLEVSGKSRFFNGLESIHLPIRHGEGRLTLSSETADELVKMVKEQAALRYSKNVNGSFDNIAALTNKNDNVLGLMPHPEAFVSWKQHPAWAQLKFGPVEGELGLSKESAETTPHGLQIFKNTAQILVEMQN